MCLLVVGWNAHPRYRLVIAGNRDEFHDRPAAPLCWWNDGPPLLAGRDLKASGTWLGLARDGRFGVVTNFRDFEPPPEGAPSRGGLLPRYLRGTARPEAYLAGLAQPARDYGGFNLLLGDARCAHYWSNRGDAPPRALSPGIYGLSNQWLDSPWPKLTRTRARFAALLDGGEIHAQALFALLDDRTAASEADLPHSGLPADWERALSAPFVAHERYGTRCATVVLVEHDGRSVVHERRFDARGGETGRSRFEFAATAPGIDANPHAMRRAEAPAVADVSSPE
jgi:uncharacterized protein with NRDE domain